MNLSARLNHTLVHLIDPVDLSSHWPLICPVIKLISSRLLFFSFGRQHRSRWPTCWWTTGGHPGRPYWWHSWRRNRCERDGRKRWNGPFLCQDSIKKRMLPAGFSNYISPAGSWSSGRCWRQRPADPFVAFRRLAGRCFRSDTTFAQPRCRCLAS